MSEKIDIFEYLSRLGPPGPFQPHSYYDADSDVMHVWFEEEEAYANPESEYLKTYRAFSDDRVVGLVVWNPSRVGLVE